MISAAAFVIATAISKPLDSSWTRLGAGCARTANGADSVVAVDVLHGIKNVRECKKICEDSDCCAGIEFNKYSDGRCELYQSDQKPATTTIEGGECARATVHVRKNPTDALDFSLVGQGCCRTDEGDDSIVAFYVDREPQSRKACRQKCVDTEGCVGFEHSRKFDSRCELYTAENAPVSATAESPSCRKVACFARSCPVSPTASP